MENIDTSDPVDLIISERALTRIAQIRETKKQPDLNLRIIVEGGGCSGFQYNLEWDEHTQSDDLSFAACVLIDPTSLSFLVGSTVDFVSTMMGEDFKILNPNAVSSCGCGTSFSV